MHIKCAESILNKFAEQELKLPTSVLRIRKVGDSGEHKREQLKSFYGIDMNLRKLECWRLVPVAGATNLLIN